MNHKSRMTLAMAMSLSVFSLTAGAVTADPWEAVNRKTFAFNDTLDTYAFKPIAQGYDAITPAPVQKGVHNVFQNIGDVGNFANNALQGKAQSAGVDLARLMLNSTIGLGGLLDVATKMGLQRNEEDFGLTLAHWGVGSGPYVVLQFLGPSTVRDTVAIIPDGYTEPYEYMKHVPTRNSVFAMEMLDKRVSLLPAEKMIQGDKYTFIRSAYLDSREFHANNGEVKDDF